MMTDDEKRGLIRSARTIEVCLDDSVPDYGATMVAKKLLRRLADALEGTLTEPEWEYGIEYEVSVEETEFIYMASREAAERWVTENPTDSSLVRRRKDGPWEVVSDEQPTAV